MTNSWDKAWHKKKGKQEEREGGEKEGQEREREEDRMGSKERGRSERRGKEGKEKHWARNQKTHVLECRYGSTVKHLHKLRRFSVP